MQRKRNVRETYEFFIEIDNLTDVDQTHRMTFTYPDGFRLSEGTDYGIS